MKLKRPTSKDPLPSYKQFEALLNQVGHEVEFDGALRTLLAVEWFPCVVSYSPHSPRLPFIAAVFEGDKKCCHSVVVEKGDCVSEIDNESR